MYYTSDKKLVFNNVTSKYRGRDITDIVPDHKMVNNWLFQDDSKDEDYMAKEANLADAMARVAEANGMSANDLHHLFPAVLRMLKSTSNWSK